jgi:hypothetical protein
MRLLEVFSSLSVLRKLINWLRRWPLTRARMRNALRPAPARFTILKKFENPGLNHLKMVYARVTSEECGEIGHMGNNCPMIPQDVNFIGNSNNGFCPNQDFNAGWNKPSFLFDNCQQGGAGQNFNKSEPSLKDVVRDQLRINL